MIRLVGLIAFAGLAAPQPAVSAEAQPAKVSAERLDDRIVVRVDDTAFTSYRFGAGQKYPYFYPVIGPLSGRSVTAESALPYPHHRSLFFGCDKVNGGNYWQEGNERGQIVSRGAAIAANGPEYVEITDVCDWRRPGQAPILTDRRRIRIEAPGPRHRIIDFFVSLVPLEDVRIERTNHSLFSARVAPELSVRSGGTLVNADGVLAEKGTFAASSPWCDYSGSHCGTVEGIAIFDSPSNPWFPSKWFTRDYGFFSPTPMEWLGPDGYRIPRGQALELRYRVVVHAGDAMQADIPGFFQSWRNAQGK